MLSNVAPCRICGAASVVITFDPPATYCAEHNPCKFVAASELEHARAALTAAEARCERYEAALRAAVKGLRHGGRLEWLEALADRIDTTLGPAALAADPPATQEAV